MGLNSIWTEMKHRFESLEIIIPLAMNAATRHSVELAYVLPDGSRSPKSSPSFGSTWAEI